MASSRPLAMHKLYPFPLPLSPLPHAQDRVWLPEDSGILFLPSGSLQCILTESGGEGRLWGMDEGKGGQNKT